MNDCDKLLILKMIDDQWSALSRLSTALICYNTANCVSSAHIGLTISYVFANLYADLQYMVATFLEFRGSTVYFERTCRGERYRGCIIRIVTKIIVMVINRMRQNATEGDVANGPRQWRQPR